MVLKHRDRELLRFEWAGARGVRVLSVNEAERMFLPLEMAGKATDESLWTWISSRTVPRFAPEFFFDALIFNTDRHMGNFGFLVDNDTNEIAGPAPIFDNGYGLFSLATYRPDLPQYHVTTEQLSKLTLLEGFRFKRHKHYNLPDDRLATIENFLAQRVSAILDYGKRADDLLRLKGGFERQSKSVGIISANAEILQVELRTVERKIRLLREAGRVTRVGSRKWGYWQVNEGGAE